MIRDTAGQEEEIEPEKEKVTHKAEHEEGDNEVEIATGYDSRMPAVKTNPGRPIISNTAAMVKPEHTNKLNNEETDHRRPAVRKVPSSVRKIGDSFELHASTTLSIKSLLQKLVRAGLDWIGPPWHNLDSEPAAAE